MRVPFLDLPAQYEGIHDEVSSAMERVLSSAQFILGDELELFEDKFAAYCGGNHCVGVASGTEALHLALRALDIGPGDEVITAANSFVATACAITYTGASPVFVDVSPRDYNIDVSLLESAITSSTKAIIPVHLYGQPAEMNTILQLAREHDVKVVEDACQAHGARYRNCSVGSLGDAGCFSFYPGKNLGAYGDGGAIVTDDPELAERLRRLRNYGQRRKNVHSELGFNCRLDTIQAAILLVKLHYLDDWNENRRRNAARYGELLQDCPVVTPAENAGVEHVYHLYAIRHEHRDAMIAHLEEAGISCGIHYPTPLCDITPFQSARTVPEQPRVSRHLAKHMLSLPMYPELSSEQIEYIARNVRSFDASTTSMCAAVDSTAGSSRI